jgi:hypothetical protein
MIQLHRGSVSHNQDNRLKAFTDVVSVDAWHDEFSPGAAKVDLHADVVFGVGRLGGEAESQVRFRLSVKRADLVLIVPENEPVLVEKRSINRLGEGLSLKRSITKTTEVKGAVATEGKLSAGIMGVSASGKTEASASAGGRIEEKLEGSQEVFAIRATYRRGDGDGFHRWTLERGLLRCPRSA